MSKNSLAEYKVSTELLHTYVRAQFADYSPPPIQQFLNIKKHNYTVVGAATFEVPPRAQLPPELAELLEAEGVVYLHVGSVQLHRKEGRSWRRDIEYKDGSFFTLINYRNVVSAEPEWFKLIFTSKSILSVLPMRPPYGFEWMKAAWLKNTILSKIFLHGDPELEIERKRVKFKEFVGHFRGESFRRETAIVQEGRKNENIYFIGKGEAKLMKQLNVHVNGRFEHHRQVEILYLREGAVFGAELFLMSSKSVHTIINHHIEHQSQDSTVHEEEGEEEEGEEGRKGKKRSRSRLSKISVEEGGYQLHSPHENISNFTVRAESANLELYYIEIDSLVSLISERYKINFLKLLESTFITVLRRTHEKMTIELRKAQEKIRNNQSKIEAIAAKAYSAQDSKSEVVSEQHQGILMKASEISIMKSTLHQFKNEEVRRAKDNHMEKRSELLSKERRTVVDFKGKIEALIDVKLAQVKEEGKTHQLIEDFTDIFMKNNEGRSEDIEKRNSLLERKRAILERRGGWQAGWDQLNQQGVKIQGKRVVEVPNYLAGVKMSTLTARIKGECNHKIHETNKIKEQFMKIKSECPSCSCYEHFETFSTQPRRTASCMGRTGCRTGEGWGRTSKVQMEEESLEKVYEKMSFLSEKTKEKYNHNIHLLQVRRNHTQLSRRRSAPKFL